MKIFDYFKKKRISKLKIGLALSGGATRGFAYIGVFRAFEQLGIKFSYVAGTSAGSIFGAMYANGFTADQMENMISSINKKDIKLNNFLFGSSTDGLRNTLIKCFGSDIVFSDLKIPFIAVATNVKTGKEVHITSGSVSKALVASSALPGVFKPVIWGDKTLVDGGVVNTLPIDVLGQFDPDFVFAVEVNSKRGNGTANPGLISTLKSTLGILINNNAKQSLENADIVLKPNLDFVNSRKFDSIPEMISEGYKCVMGRADEILKIINKKPKKSKIWKEKIVEVI